MDADESEIDIKNLRKSSNELDSKLKFKCINRNKTITITIKIIFLRLKKVKTQRELLTSTCDLRLRLCSKS